MYYSPHFEKKIKEGNLVTKQEYEMLRDISEIEEKNIIDVLIKYEVKPEEEVIEYCIKGNDYFLGFEIMPEIEQTIADDLSDQTSRIRKQIVSKIDNNNVEIYTSNVYDLDVLEKTRHYYKKIGYSCSFHAITRMQLEKLRFQRYDLKSKLKSQLKNFTLNNDTFNEKIKDIISMIITWGVQDSASDIIFRIENNDSTSCIYFIKDKIKQYRLSMKTLYVQSIVKSIQLESGMDSSALFGHQDGSLNKSIFNDAYNIQLRISTITNVQGRQMVIRILNNSNKTKLSKLGFDYESEKSILNSIKYKKGIVLIVGSTGSGKTTTLYAMLDNFNPRNTNIITIEDPVEIRRKDFNQVQINERAGQTFAKTIRACLRQAPDIILIGEIRDKETAARAIEAANTGHLVFCTLHTNSLNTINNRLIELGVENLNSFNTNLKLSIYQELVSTSSGLKLDYDIKIGGGK